MENEDKLFSAFFDFKSWKKLSMEFGPLLVAFLRRKTLDSDRITSKKFDVLIDSEKTRAVSQNRRGG